MLSSSALILPLPLPAAAVATASRVASATAVAVFSLSQRFAQGASSGGKVNHFARSLLLKFEGSLRKRHGGLVVAVVVVVVVVVVVSGVPIAAARQMLRSMRYRNHCG